MDEITPEILRQIMPTLSKGKRELYAPLLEASMSEQDINNERRAAAYLANLAHESMNLTRWEENLSYSAQRLVQVWPNRFPTIAAASPFAHNPEALANKTYGGRMGNTQPGDGWKYRGRFPLQCTGKELYLKASKALNLPLLYTDPDSCMDDPMIGFRVSAWIFAKEKGGNQLADRQQIKALTKAINGGYNGLQERIDLYNRGLRILPDDFKLTTSAAILREDEDSVPDYIEGAENHLSISDHDKGLSTSLDKMKGTTEGVPPPVPAVEIKGSSPSWMSRITALSLPAGAAGVMGTIWKFAKTLPTESWIIIGVVFAILCIVGAWLYNESMKRAQQRTIKIIDSAADSTKNNIRLI